MKIKSKEQFFQVTEKRHSGTREGNYENSATQLKGYAYNPMSTKGLCQSTEFKRNKWIHLQRFLK